MEALLSLEGFDHDELSHRTAVLEDKAAADLRKEDVVLAAADVQARFHTGAALTNDDGAAGNHLAAECLESQSLRVRVAPIA